MMVHGYCPSGWKAEAGGLIQYQGQPGLQSKTCLEERKEGVWGYTPVITEVGRRRQKDQELKDNFYHLGRTFSIFTMSFSL